MDLLEFDNVKAEKETAMLTYIPLGSFTKLFRVLELCVALVLLPWLFSRLPFAVRISGEIFWWVAGIIASPLFVFVIFNAIIATLIVKSVRFSGENPAANNAGTELYEEFIKNSENRCPKSLSENPLPPPSLHLSHLTTEEEIVFQDKEIVSQVNAVSRTCEAHDDVVERDLYSSDSDLDTPKVYRRTKSEKLETATAAEKVKVKLLLRRSETEKFLKMEKSEGENMFPEDDLNDEEFQRAIDDFIARQLMFRRQESLAFVGQIQSHSSICETEQK